MLNRKNKPVKILYGIRHRLDAWMFVESKAARDSLWENVSRYPHVACDWEICEKVIRIEMPQPIEVIPAVAA